MLADDPAMHIVWCDVEFLTDQKMKPSCVKVRSTSYHTLMGKTADFPRHIGQNVHWKNWRKKNWLDHNSLVPREKLKYFKFYSLTLFLLVEQKNYNS